MKESKVAMREYERLAGLRLAIVKRPEKECCDFRMLDSPCIEHGLGVLARANGLGLHASNLARRLQYTYG